MSLFEQVLQASSFPTTKAEVIEAYQHQYTGRGAKGWKQHMVNALSQLTGMKPKNLEKRLDPQRRSNPEPRNAKQYEELGRRFKPQAPEGGYHIFGFVYIKFSDGECEEREVDVEITGDEAEELLDVAWTEAGRELTQMVVNAYMEADFGDETSAHVDDCKPPRLTVDPIE